jgi:hypothetical protein
MVQSPDEVPSWLALLLPALLIGFAIWRYLVARRQRPRFERGEVVYQEWFASGSSERNLVTRLGGARNCLRLVVTHEVLWVTSWPPFSLLAPLYDLEHVIPLQSITGVKHSRIWWMSSLLLSYADEEGSEHTLRLFPRHPREFLQALGHSDDW